MQTLTRQAGTGTFLTTRDPRLGIIAVTLKCYAPDYETALFAPALDIGIPIPEWNPRQIAESDAGRRAS